MPTLTLTEAFSDIADAIRDKNGTQNTYTPAQMPAAIEDLDTDPPVLQTKTINPNETLQIITPDSGYDALSRVDITAINSNYIGSGVTRRDSTDLTASGASVTAPAGYYAEAASKSVSTATQATPSISVNTTTGEITATHTQTAGYVSAGTKTATEQLSTVNGSTITPTEAEQTAVTANKYTLGAVKVGAISSTYVGSNIPLRSSSDLTASSATVTVPAGYYGSQATKSVTNGSATGPSSLSGSSATVSTGTNTLTLTKTGITTTPTVNAGYISSGTTSSATVTLTANVTTKAAATITPGTTNQEIAAGTYLTGTQTISGDSDLTAANIKTGTQIFGVTGSYTSDATAAATDIVSGETAYVNGSKITGSLVINKYYTGSSAPSSSLGNNGDIYFQS